MRRSQGSSLGASRATEISAPMLVRRADFEWNAGYTHDTVHHVEAFVESHASANLGDFDGML
jgi:hypothetical protein